MLFILYILFFPPKYLSICWLLFILLYSLIIIPYFFTNPSHSPSKNHYLPISLYIKYTWYIQRYKDQIRAELNKHLRAEFDKRITTELTQAIPPTETLNVEAAKEKAGLARQGSLAERQPPASLVQKRQQLIGQGAPVNSDMPEDEICNDDEVVEVKQNHIKTSYSS